MYDVALERDTHIARERDIYIEGERERAVIDICFMCTHIGIETVNIF